MIYPDEITPADPQISLAQEPKAVVTAGRPAIVGLDQRRPIRSPGGGRAAKNHKGDQNPSGRFEDLVEVAWDLHQQVNFGDWLSSRHWRRHAAQLAISKPIVANVLAPLSIPRTDMDASQRKQRERHVKAQRLRSLELEYQVEPGRRRGGRAGGRRPSKDR